jgi:hypothetical protein
MHTGQIRTISAVVSFFDLGGNQNGYPGTNEIHALGLSPREENDLSAFLAALSPNGS